MLTADDLIQNRDNLEKLSDSFDKADIAALVELLNEKDNDIRYASFLALQQYSGKQDGLYSYWDVLSAKFDDENSYQRSLGIMLIAENIRWDHENKFEEIIDAYLAHCNDEKFITSRQTIQSIGRWIALKPHLIPAVVDRLTKTDIDSFKETQRKLILTDIVDVLLQINKIQPSSQITDYILASLTGGLLDKKTVQEIKSQL